jgi:hypothetical protein
MQIPSRTLAAALLTCALTPVSFAQEVYVEGFVGTLDTHGSDALKPELELDYPVIGFRTGYEFNQYLAIEGELMTGTKSVPIDVQAPYSDLDIKMRSHAAVFGRVSAPLSERLSVHGRLGYGSLELTTSVPAYDDSGYIDTFDGPAFGFGTKFDLSDTVYLRGDHAQYVSKSRENRVFTLGAGVNLFQVAKVVNDLRD